MIAKTILSFQAKYLYQILVYQSERTCIVYSLVLSNIVEECAHPVRLSKVHWSLFKDSVSF